MEIRIVDIDNQVLRDLFCKACVYWECPAQFREVSPEKGERIKSEWFETTAALFNPCGKLLYVDDEPAAYCQYAPPQYVPGILEYGKLADCVDKGGVMITCLYVPEPHQRKGLGRRLLKEVVEELRSRGYKAVETFACDDSANNCSGPTKFYLAQGFMVVQTETFPGGMSFSLVRLELGG